MKAVLFFLLFLLPTYVQAQERDIEWTRLSGPAGDLTFSLPADFLVDNDRTELRAYSRKEGATIKVEIERNVDPQRRLLGIRQYRNNTTPAQYAQLTLGNFIGDSYIFDEKGYSITLYLASKKGFYTISGSAKTSSHPVLLKFLHSIRLGEQALLKQANPTNYAQAAVSIEKYKPSPLIVEALKPSNAKKGKVTYEEESVTKSVSVDPSTRKDYSQPILILRNPRAQLTSAARLSMVNGIVKLRVLLLANGQVGDIIVLRKLGDGLTSASIKAAREIRFLPAEMDGRPVDVERTFEYSFSIY